MKIIHLTDLHLPAPGEELWGLDPFARADSALTDIAERHGDADFCVISGDLADSGIPGAYEWLADRLNRFPLETVLMIGNHDDRAAAMAHLPGLQSDSAGFVQSFRETDAGRFIFLDTSIGDGSAGALCADRLAWLHQALDGDGPFWIFMHHPPFDIGVPYVDRIKLEDPEGFAEIVRGKPVRHLFFGHVHRPIFVTWRGIPCNALPATAHQVPLDRPAMGTSYSYEPAMYGVILIDDEQVTVHLDAWMDRKPAEMDW